ncbi:alternate-type signal peptide domain-containing protein [Nocardioides sp. GY 10127]|uniref:alternate-type signal peptide domain-containing protein n=1 Tax=Nocardioides sp. GY 10127 TaxID=2569762 RepID=UPI0010A889FE|nr:alternate-type signal peptide domain-containing protein [Nocardioides sp. GY 10127]TIC85517.1 alternate-type signal peptide domain-containing protein [Nocardioides sp. GY 10127]
MPILPAPRPGAAHPGPHPGPHLGPHPGPHSHRARGRRLPYVRSALAAGAGVLVLLQVGGTLASWTDGIAVDGVDDLTAGSMALTDTTVGTCAAAGWTLDSAEDPAGAAFLPASQRLVPGDVLTKDCTFTLAATGEHLRATLSTTSPTATGALAGELSVGGTFTVDSVAATEVTDADDGATIAATLTITYAGTADNTTQLTSADIGGYTVSLDQVHD